VNLPEPVTLYGAAIGACSLANWQTGGERAKWAGLGNFTISHMQCLGSNKDIPDKKISLATVQMLFNIIYNK